MSRRALGPEQRFGNRVAQVALAFNFAVITIIGFALVVAEPSSLGFGLVTLLVGGGIMVRALRSSDVVVDDSSVRTRSIVHTHRYAFSELHGVDVAVGRTGLSGFGREYLTFHLTDGRDVAFRELNCRPPKADEPTVVRRAAACINERLASVRTSGDAAPSF